MAARTLLFDPRLGAWSPRLCELFGVPSALLPRVLPSSGRGDELDNGLVLTTSVADQSAGALHAVGTGSSGALINFGTGTFVLVPNGERWLRRPGYLTSLLASLGADPLTRVRSFALEGTVNAGAALIASGDSLAGSALDDLPQDAWALVDENGIGAPHWRAELGPIWSPRAAQLDPSWRRRVGELGLCFRVREILADLQGAGRRCVVAGGALHDSAFAQRLADALGRTIEVSLDPEATLAGVARLANGGDLEHGRAMTRCVEPGKGAVGLEARFETWRRWVAASLAR
jgi:glycerol kinase